MTRTTSARRTLGTALLCATIALAYAAAAGIEVLITFPLFIICVFAFLFNGAYHGSKY